MTHRVRSIKVVTYVVLIVGALIMLMPFIWMFFSAFKGESDIYVYPPHWLPSKWHFENFTEVFQMVPFLRFYLNSIIVTTTITVTQILFSILAAYAFSRLNFPLKNTLFILVISTMLMPFQVIVVPTFLVVYKFGWINTYQGLIVPFLFNAFSIFLLKQFFMTIPKDLEDAAKIDGCGRMKFLFGIMVPLSRPAIGTVVLFTFLVHWKDYLWPLVITNSTNMRTLPVGLKYLITEGGEDYRLMMAAALMAIVPILVVFILAEKQFIRGITLTGLKG